jgi:cell division transport system ATP-binding protein
VISLFNVTKKFASGQIALNNVSLQIASGEMVFLQGHSGAGKTTLLKMIGLLESPTRGHIVVNGQNINHLPPEKIPFYRRNLGFISQNPRLLDNHTVFDNVALPLVVTGADDQEIKRRTQAALERVGLLHKEKAYPLTLSEGERQRVSIARAVVHKPSFLLADEPTGNLDPALSMEIIKLFERFHKVGVTVLIASHDQSLIEKFTYRSLYLSQGQLVHSDKSPASVSVSTPQPLIKEKDLADVE